MFGPLLSVPELLVSLTADESERFNAALGTLNDRDVEELLDEAERDVAEEPGA